MKSLLLALLLAAQAAAEKPLVGLWGVEMQETASALQLREGGRLSFVFSQGALDTGAEGKFEPIRAPLPRSKAIQFLFLMLFVIVVWTKKWPIRFFVGVREATGTTSASAFRRRD